MPDTYVKQRVHLVWSTRNRQPWLDTAWRTRLYAYTSQVVRTLGGTLFCAGGMRDHLHLYLEYPATLALAAVVNTIKTNSSRWIHQTFPHRSDFHWQVGYAAFSVNPQNDGALQSYIRNQEQHHREADFPAEYLALLRAHGVRYDDRHVLD